jgi:hypothetical protein
MFILYALYLVNVAFDRNSRYLEKIQENGNDRVAFNAVRNNYIDGLTTIEVAMMVCFTKNF